MTSPTPTWKEAIDDILQGVFLEGMVDVGTGRAGDGVISEAKIAITDLIESCLPSPKSLYFPQPVDGYDEQVKKQYYKDNGYNQTLAEIKANLKEVLK